MNSSAIHSPASVQLAQVSTDALDSTKMDMSAMPQPLSDIPVDSAAQIADPALAMDPWTLGNSGGLDAGNTDWLDGPRLANDALNGVPADTPATLSQLTKPFFRGDAARTSAAGAGLGLSIVAKNIERMGGTFALTSTPGRGFAAHIRMPRAMPSKSLGLNGKKS